MKILVAEDDKLVLKTLELYLKKGGYEVITSSDGLDAMVQFEAEQPDMIITDLMLPFLSGLEILGKVKQRRKDVPVIVLSAMGQESVIAEAMKLGADHYISKPFNVGQLSQEISKISHVHRKERLHVQ